MSDPAVFYSSCSKLEPERFETLFSTFNRSAYRLELLPAYAVPEEAEALTLFSKGGPRPPQFGAEWHALLDAARNDGKIFSRTRLIPEMTPYIKFEIEWGYSENAKHGEKINVIESSDLAELSSTVPLLCDFWLFDERICCLMQYDAAGQFLGVLQVPANAVELYVALQRSLVGRGGPFTL